MIGLAKVEDIEICDRCNSHLDQRANEDIRLSKIGIVLCELCYNNHVGIEVYR